MSRPCLLCGTRKSKIMRCRRLDEVRDHVQQHVRPSLFVWQYVCDLLMHEPGDQQVYMCASCGQWLRRVATTGANTKPYLLVDQIIHACLQMQIESDEIVRSLPRHAMQRCVYTRVVLALREKGNHVITCAPPVAREIIMHQLPANSLAPSTHISLAWWDFHNCPEFLPNAEIARAVRLRNQ
jgi:hypothetical protein